MEPQCSVCHLAVQPTFYFCPNCGNPLQAKPVSISVLTQIGIYALSIFLPPLGLWPGIKYARNPDAKAKQVGIIAIILTVASTIVTIWATAAFFQLYITTLTQSLGGVQ